MEAKRDLEPGADAEEADTDSGARALSNEPDSAPVPESGPVAVEPGSRVGAEVLAQLPSTPTRQFDLCILAPIDPARLQALRQLLERVHGETLRAMQGQDVERPAIDWAKLTTIHYARFVIIEAYERFGSPPMLAFSTNYDGPLGQARAGRAQAQREHLEQLVTVAGDALDELYRCCKGYSGKDGLGAYMARHQVSASTFYVGSSGRPRDQVLGERALREQISTIVDELYRHSPQLSAEEVREAVRSNVSIRQWDVPRFPPQPDGSWKVSLARGAAIALGAGTLFGLGSGILPLQIASASLLGAIGVAVLALRHKEETDPEFQPHNSTAELRHLEEVSRDENRFLQNELTHLVDVKPGLLRAGLVRAVFAALQFLAQNLYNKGKLGGIPSIHFARWCLVDEGRRLLFFSNFDNSWQSYLGDFIDQASSGLTAVWSNSVGYPKTRWLLRAGSRDAGRFKAWTRHHQIRTQVWYSAYPNLSIQNVNANTHIRRGLVDPKAMSAPVWLDWLQGLDRAAADAQYAAEKANPSLQKPSEWKKERPPLREPLELGDVQGLILRGYGVKRGAEYLLLRVEPGRAASAKKWLAQLPLTSASGAGKGVEHPDPYLNVAFSHRGLAALELDQSLLEDFPPAFVQDSAHPTRCLINGDLGQSGPEHWRWGAGDRAVDVLVLVYASTAEKAKQHADETLSEAQEAGLCLVERLAAGELPGRKEHFGFRDGIAQPVVRGVTEEEPAYNTLEPGEFLLGHHNGYGNVAHAPKAADGWEFGKNGSFLVFRQLVQDVEGFWRFCDEQGQRLHSDAVTVASKMVGRWPSGASLVKHPAGDPRDEKHQNEEAFAYLANGRNNDRGGAACPFGSHLRRTNPRDWNVGNDRHESLEISNRHRIIRRGRPYGAPLTESMSAESLIEGAKVGAVAQERGLQFLAFSADLERQFEFVQQQWSQNTAFAGLNDSPDPISGGQLATGAPCVSSFTIQKDSTQSSFGRCCGMNSFVEVVGSTYFFMPAISAVRALGERS